MSFNNISLINLNSQFNPFYNSITIDSLGNVGVGKTEPTTNLDVTGNIKFSGVISGSGSNLISLNATNITDGVLSVRCGGTGATTLTSGSILVGNERNTILQPTNLVWDNATNRVGIGKNNPGTTLDVSGSITSTGLICSGGAVVIDIANNVNINYGTLYIDGNKNNVGIGTIQPDSNTKLHVSGNAIIEGDLRVNGTVTQIDTEVSITEQLNITNNGTGPAVIINQTGAQPIIDIKDDSETCFKISDGGHIAIGSINKIVNVDISGNIKLSGIITGSGAGLSLLNMSNASDGILTVGRGGTGVTSFVSGQLLIGNGTDPLLQSSNLVWNNISNRLGIGIINPTSKLHIAMPDATGTTTNLLDFRNSSIYGIYATSFGVGSRGNTLDFFSRDYNLGTITTRNLLSLRPEGNVGIGITNPTTKLEIYNGDIKLNTNWIAGATMNLLGYNTDKRLEFSYDNGTSLYDNLQIRFFTNTIERMRIISSGNIGIGKNNPITPLDVAGTVTATLFSGSGASLSGLIESQIPALPQSRITGLDTSFNSKQNLINNILAGEIILGNGASGIQSTSNLSWNTSTNRLGIGKIPDTPLDVSGTVTATLFSGSGASLSGLTASQIPALPQSKITGLDTSLNAKQNLINNILAGEIILGNGTSGIQSTSNLTWNTSTNRLGIGKTPTTPLDVAGTITATLFSGSGASLTGLTTSQIPDLAQSKIIGLDTSFNTKQNVINNTAGEIILGNGTSGIQSTPNLTWNTSNNRLGIGKTPDTPLDVLGTVTATLFSGSGASLTGLTSSQIPTLAQSKITGLDTSLNSKQNLINNITAGQIILGNGTSGIQSTSNLIWNTSTNRLGIGKIPDTPLDVSGTITATLFSGSGTSLSGLTASQIPDLAQSKITGLDTSLNAKQNLINNTAGEIILGNGASGIQSSSNLTWNTSNNRLGIGKTPDTQLDVSGTVTAILFSGSGASLYGLTTSQIPTLPQTKITGLDTSLNTKQNLINNILAGEIILGNGASGIQSSSNLTWNTSNNRLGIGKTPDTPLDVSGTVTATLFSGSGASLSGLTVSQIPALPQTKITGLDASLIAKQNLINNITAGQVILGNGASGIQSSSNLTWNTSNNRLGIGKTPDTQLDVSGTVTATLFSGSGVSLTGLTASQIPILPQTKITGLDTSLNAKQNLINNITAGQVILGNGTLGIQSTSNLTWNTSTNRLGIGKIPDTPLDVSGTVTATLFSGSGNSLTSLNASNITGTLQVSKGGTGCTSLNTTFFDTSGGILSFKSAGISEVTAKYISSANLLTSLNSLHFTNNVTSNKIDLIKQAVAETADTLTNARMIGGTSFNGSADIDIGLATLATLATTANYISSLNLLSSHDTTQFTNNTTLNKLQLLSTYKHPLAAAADTATNATTANTATSISSLNLLSSHDTTQFTNNTTLNKLQMLSTYKHPLAVAADTATNATTANTATSISSLNLLSSHDATQFTNNTTLNKLQLLSTYKHPLAAAADTATNATTANTATSISSLNLLSSLDTTQFTNNTTLNKLQLLSTYKHPLAAAADTATNATTANIATSISSLNLLSSLDTTQFTNNTTLNKLQLSSSSLSKWTAGATATNIYYSAGNVSIGTTTTSDTDDNATFAIPTATLYIKGGDSASGTCSVVIKGGNLNGNNGKARLWLTANNGYSSYIESEHTGSGNTILTLGTSNANALPVERMRIDSNGNVGIGTVDPTSKLHIIHNSTATTAEGTGGVGLYVYNSTNAASNNSIISNRIAGSTANKVIYAMDVYNAFGWSMYLQGSDTTNNRLRFHSATDGASGTDRMVINGTNGNVGIGTITPSSKLTINDIVVDRNSFDHSESPLTITHQTATSTTVLNDPKSVLHLCRQGTTSAVPFGVKASFKLCRWENNSTNSRTRLDITLANASYDDVNIISMRSDGNVGIGKTNPGTTLDVTGTITTSKLVITGTAGATGLDMSTTDQYAEMRVIRNSLSSIDKNLYLGFAAGTGSKVFLYSNSTETMRCDAGNVVISGNLYVGPVGGVSTIFLGGGAAEDNDVDFKMSVIGSRLYSGTENTEIIIFKGNDVGTSAEADRIRLRAGAIVFDTFPGASIDREAENIRMVIIGSGNVGIGNTAPAVLLHVGSSTLSADIAATGNITAYYSDERLKTKISNINEPLKIINNLNGFYYVPNELAHKNGIIHTNKEIGLSAQDVQKVLPELINIAPFDLARDKDGNKVSKSGENYLTISYERLAPVFVEAIKELQKENIELNEKYNKLLEDIILIKQTLNLI